jgi:hypothetical protein
MYYSEYLRNKKLGAPKIVSPPRGRSSGLWTQMQRYKSSRIQDEPSSEGVLGAKGNAAVCCIDTIALPVTLACTAQVMQEPLPRGFYGPPRPVCPPINNGPVIASSCCDP